MSDDQKSKSSALARGLRRLGGSPLIRDIGGLIGSAISAAIAALRNNALLLLLVGLTGAISYDSLYVMADRVYDSEWVPVLYPLQFDVAAIPAFQVVVDATRGRGARWFAGVMCVLTVAGSMYGNLVAHFDWQGDEVLAYVSLWPPFAFSAGVLLMHLGHREVVDPPAGSSRYVEGTEPTDSSSSVTKGTTADEPERPSPTGTPARVDLHAVGPRIPDGPWTDSSAPSIRRFVAAFWDLNDRAPSTGEVCDHMPAKVREQRQASTQIEAVRRQREQVG